jgi:hypothetical protein
VHFFSFVLIFSVFGTHRYYHRYAAGVGRFLADEDQSSSGFGAVPAAVAMGVCVRERTAKYPCLRERKLRFCCLLLYLLLWLLNLIFYLRVTVFNDCRRRFVVWFSTGS